MCNWCQQLRFWDGQSLGELKIKTTPKTGRSQTITFFHSPVSTGRCYSSDPRISGILKVNLFQSAECWAVDLAWGGTTTLGKGTWDTCVCVCVCMCVYVVGKRLKSWLGLVFPLRKRLSQGAGSHCRHQFSSGASSGSQPNLSAPASHLPRVLLDMTLQSLKCQFPPLQCGDSRASCSHRKS